MGRDSDTLTGAPIKADVDIVVAWAAEPTTMIDEDGHGKREVPHFGSSRYGTYAQGYGEGIQTVPI